MRLARASALLALAALVSSVPPGFADDPTTAVPARRLPWDDSQIVGTPDPPLPYKTAKAFPDLEVERPLAMFPEPGTDRLFLLEHLNHWSGPSRLRALPDRPDGATEDLVTLLDMESLAIGLAFHPQYERNGYVYLGVNGQSADGANATRVLRYTIGRTPPHALDPASERLIIEWPSNGHNGGDLCFGNDGYLYVTSGDGSSGSDADDAGQSIDDLTGAVLRIDVDHPDPGLAYGIPADNPFVDRPGARAEIWAYGLRNPWRISSDPVTGQIWVGNNGQDLWEQVYLLEKGANYGWPVVEGSHIFQSRRTPGPDPISEPMADHPHSQARSLTGGRVYRGTRLPDLVGTYVYGDWSTGRIWGIKVEGGEVTWRGEIADTPFNITGFGTDHDGELYVIDQVSGYYRLEPTTEADHPSHPFPTLLSATGLFASVADHRPHPAAIPYEVAAPQWADGAAITRFVALTGLERIEQHPQKNAGGSWTLPEGSALAQTLSLDVAGPDGKPSRKRIETRVLVRQQGEWDGYSYRWNAEGTDAELIEAEGDVAEFQVADPSAPEGVREQIWRFPSRTECLVCHSRASGFHLGFSPLGLDRDRDYGDASANQLDLFERIGVFEGALPERSPDRPRLVNPYDESAPLEARARSYLHVNCSVCHVGEGGGNARMELALRTPTDRMNLIGEPPVHSDFEIQDARLVAPGEPDRSILLRRISIRETGQMPPLVSTEVDREAVEMLTEWIRGLGAEAEGDR